MKLERSKPEDAAECVRWMLANLVLNDCSPRTLKGSIFYKIPGILYLPIKPVIMLESLAPNPEVTGKRRLLAIRRAMDDIRAMYPGTEFIFLTKGNTKLDEAARFYGFKEESYRVYRLIPGRKRMEGDSNDYRLMAGTRAKKIEASGELDETRLRHHQRTGGAKEAQPTRHVSSVRSASRNWRSQESSCGGSHQGNDNDQGHTPQSLQLSHRARA